MGSSFPMIVNLINKAQYYVQDITEIKYRTWNWTDLSKLVKTLKENHVGLKLLYLKKPIQVAKITTITNVILFKKYVKFYFSEQIIHTSLFDFYSVYRLATVL